MQIYQDELAQLYDAAVPDWPGEIAFYRQLIDQATPAKPSVLEVACGTGRVTIQLASSGMSITGIDLSDEMLAYARAKSAGMSNVLWQLADMRSFQLAQTFDLAIVPAYSFQLLLTEAEQMACLRHIARHLNPGACLAMHLEQHDPEWLDSLPTDGFTPFEMSGETNHPDTGQRIRVSVAWSHVVESCSVAVAIRYESIDGSGTVISRTDRAPMYLHCTSLKLLQEQMAGTGFKMESVFGDFLGSPYESDSEEMICVARKL